MIWPLIIAAASSLGGAYLQNRGQQRAMQSQERQAQASLQESRFRPYTVRTSMNGATFIDRDKVQSNLRLWGQQGQPQTTNQNGVNGFVAADGQFYPLEETAYANADPRLTRATNSAMDSASAITQSNQGLLSRGVQGMAEDIYNKGTQRFQGQRALDVDRLMGTLGSTGTRGHMVNDGGFNIDNGTAASQLPNKPVPGQMRASSGDGPVGPSQNPSITGAAEYNPLVASAFRGFAEQDYTRWNNSYADAMGVLDGLLKQQSNAWASAAGLNDLETSGIKLGAELGGRNMNPTGVQVLSNLGTAQAGYQQQQGRQNSALFSQLAGNKDLQRALGDIFNRGGGAGADPATGAAGFGNGPDFPSVY